jgi:hypothetical protein
MTIANIFIFYSIKTLLLFFLTIEFYLLEIFPDIMLY